MRAQFRTPILYYQHGRSDRRSAVPQHCFPAAAMKLRANQTLFDKLVADSPAGHETAMRATLLRELGWLLNTTNLAAVEDLAAVPQVATSTLNYGLGDLSGTLLTRPGVQARARDMRDAILRFEPRIDRRSLDVEPLESGRPNRVSFLIRGDVTAAVAAVPVEIWTEVEVDTGAASLGER